MNKRFMKNVLTDLFILWPLIVFGIILNVDYVSNVAIAYLWLMIVFGILGGSLASTEDGLKGLLKSKKNPRTKMHKRYQYATTILEITVLFAVGYFWLGGFFVVAAIFSIGALDKIDEHLIKNEGVK